MFTLAFYLAVLTFFVPKKVKKIIGPISIGITGILLCFAVAGSFCHRNLLGASGSNIFYFGLKANPLYWIFYKFLFGFIRRIFGLGLLHIIIFYILYYGVQIAIACVGMKVSVIKYASDSKVDAKKTIDKENTDDQSQNKILDEKYTPISMWGYFGYEILFTLPVIGWIILIVKALSSKNINVKNFARSYFCLLIIGIVIAIICFVAASSSGMFY